MKQIRHIESEEEILVCDSCDAVIFRINMWRAFESGCVMESGESESLDFCSKKCAEEWIKKNIMVESIETSKVKKFKEKIEGMDADGF